MGLISYFYKKKLVCRYDKQVAIPYYSHQDFKGLNQERYIFTNSKGIELHYFYYYYPNYKKDKIVLFCHGIGPGHTAYLKEIEWLAKAGYKVLTLDYTGCGESKGDILGSLYTPTYDALELLKYLHFDAEIIPVGHSLGGFTALNVIANREDINRAVIMSGFLSVSLLMNSFLKSKWLAKGIIKYESKFALKQDKNYILDFLKTTSKEILFIQSIDDNVVPYAASVKVVEEAGNSHLKVIKENHKKHNPNYTVEAVNYMSSTFNEYYSKIKAKTIKTNEQKIEFFKNVSLDKLTEQDPKIVKATLDFIES